VRGEKTHRERLEGRHAEARGEAEDGDPLGCGEGRRVCEWIGGGTSGCGHGRARSEMGCNLKLEKKRWAYKGYRKVSRCSKSALVTSRSAIDVDSSWEDEASVIKSARTGEEVSSRYRGTLNSVLST